MPWEEPLYKEPKPLYTEATALVTEDGILYYARCFNRRCRGWSNAYEASSTPAMRDGNLIYCRYCRQDRRLEAFFDDTRLS